MNKITRLESHLERKLVEMVKIAGGLAPKFVSPGINGMPDRLIILKGLRALAEIKRPGEEPSDIQLARHRQLRKLGVVVYVIDSENTINTMMNELQTAQLPKPRF